MGVGGSINILFKADLTQYVAHRPCVLYWVVQPGSDVGGIGMGLVRMVRPWNEWLIVWGYDINQPAPEVDDAFATKVARELVGEPKLDVEIESVSTWTVNNMLRDRRCRRGGCSAWATRCIAIPRPTASARTPRSRTRSTSPGSSRLCSRARRAPKLLDSYEAERAPIAKQIVTRANQSIGEFGPIFEALGLLDSTDPEKMKQNMDARCRRYARGGGAAQGDARGDRLQGL